MKTNFFLSMLVLFACAATLPAQITREQADEIVLKHMSQETRLSVIHAKENVQTKMAVTTSACEELELDYPCWVYYVSYADVNCCLGRYLIVNENNGNLLEVDAKSGAEPENLAEWRKFEGIWHVKAELGGCNLGLRSNEAGSINSTMNTDTVIITISENLVNVFVGFTYTCKSVPFETQVDIIDDIMHIHIIDTCRAPNKGCYQRCVCNYTFDFVFNYQGELYQKYRIIVTDAQKETLFIISEGCTLKE